MDHNETVTTILGLFALLAGVIFLYVQSQLATISRRLSELLHKQQSHGCDCYSTPKQQAQHLEQTPQQPLSAKNTTV